MRRLLALLLLPVLLLAACGSDEAPEGGDGPTAASTDSATDSGTDSGTDSATPAEGNVSFDDVQVEGGYDEPPTVTVGGSLVVEEAASRVLVEGEGDPVEAGQAMRMNYTIVDGATGEELGTSFGVQPENVVLDEGAVIEPFVSELVGQPVGSRVLLAVPPQLPVGQEGTDEGAEPVPGQQTVLFVIDVQASFAPRATGEPVDPPEGLPTVELAENGLPTITVPDAEAPAELLVQPLIVGDGPPVEQGQVLTAMYTGVIWEDGEQFDSSWDRGAPTDFPIGTGGVIDAWDTALVGQPIGSQVLISAPPSEGYGDQGQPQAGIEGTDTLVFVVDVLAARDA